MELTLRRRAIYTGMRPYFDDEALLNAINLWQAEYSHKQKFALSVFVARCCNTAQLKLDRPKILGAIFMAMDLASDELLPDPFVELNANNVFQPEIRQAQDHTTKVFTMLLQQMFLKFNKRDEEQLRKFLIDHLHEVKTDKMRLMYIREWLSLHTSDLEGTYELEVLRQLINLVYVAMCQSAGPVKADQYLSQSIRETEPLSQESGFKLHDLL
ncbi:hypothetical protein [Methylotenera sp. G11]|uniref:hypothetical protein n=1 Tax=Methylotenera sp. G11 TaxID=1506585 RepID=UPI00126A3563|nr:hypothetical protein [Methylotenera sp. G11]